ncbi:hypothetical protein DPMN_036887 [Dreissena polymorpha]|uniref:Uncharacterized protein n=1 Tax=Dreissena polymorpha TaxID=45954 RepID=A0A9D4MA93_DREPO|nr:hypothetical protein DPMN_036887 [Dreissena polymorpha]
MLSHDKSFPLPIQVLSDFQYLSSYLRLNVKRDSTVIEPSKLTSAAQCVDWLVEEAHTLTRAWCTDLINFANKNPQDGRVGIFYALGRVAYSI